MEHGSLIIDPLDLSPGDTRAADFDFSGFQLHLIRASSHRLFDVAYRKLWDEFGSHGGMEQRSVIVSRLKWDPASPLGGWSFLYRMIAVTTPDERMIAARDCTAMRHAHEAPDDVLVHLSHVLVDSEFRGGGLGAWMRAFPIQVARQCHAAAGGTGTPRVTLLAEMEYPTAHDPMSFKRLASYEKAGFVKVDPSVVRYVQPDFRDPSEIDSSGGPVPLPYQLVIRRVGREQEQSIPGREARWMVRSLYSMYADGFRPNDMDAAWRTLARYPADDAVVRLVAPTS